MTYWVAATKPVRDGQWHYDSSYERIVTSAEESLRALGTEYIDVLLLHRPDALVEPEKVARAFNDLESVGMVRAFGVSNRTSRQIDLLKTAVRQPLVANQVQPSVTHSTIVSQGLASNMAGAEGIPEPGLLRRRGVPTAQRHTRPPRGEVRRDSDRDRDGTGHPPPGRHAVRSRHNLSATCDRGRSGFRHPTHAGRVVRPHPGRRSPRALITAWS
ncbi:aldo/keto reductase [Streptomyces sp. NPDC020571]|uniref:aldo/keto reductase n=1 Tax=Streptomyces sp. NPDC020571 TaxID=3365079 RepID=UPI0037B6DE4D